MGALAGRAQTPLNPPVPFVEPSSAMESAGRDALSLVAAQRAQELGFPSAAAAIYRELMQRPALPEGRVQAALAAPFALRVHRGKHYSDEVARGYLATVGIDGTFLEQETDRLSGGEAQIVNVLRALLIAPRILLLDEPTAALDPARTACVEALVQAWLREADDRACLWVSHDGAQRARVSDHVLTLGAAA